MKSRLPPSGGQGEIPGGLCGHGRWGTRRRWEGTTLEAKGKPRSGTDRKDRRQGTIKAYPEALLGGFPSGIQCTKMRDLISQLMQSTTFPIHANLLQEYWRHATLYHFVLRLPS